MLTKEEAAQNAAAYFAAKNGKPWEFFCSNREWVEPESMTIETALINGWLCRAKPEPEPPQPWDCADDVPSPICWLRQNRDSNQYLVTKVELHGLRIDLTYLGFAGLVDYRWEYSIDRKEWKPCVKEGK